MNNYQSLPSMLEGAELDKQVRKVEAILRESERVSKLPPKHLRQIDSSICHGRRQHEQQERRREAAVPSPTLPAEPVRPLSSAELRGIMAMASGQAKVLANAPGVKRFAANWRTSATG